MRLGVIALATLVLAEGMAWAASGDSLVVTGDGVNVRFRPSTDAPIMMQIHRNQQVIELQREGEWVRAEIAGTGGQEGWIHGSLLSPGAGAAPVDPALDAAPPASPEQLADTARALAEQAAPDAAPSFTAEPAAPPAVTVEGAPAAPAPEPAREVAAATEGQPGAEPAAAPVADLGGLARFRETVEYLNSRTQQVAGVALFTEVEPFGERGVQVGITEAWSTVPPAGQRSYLNTLLDRWAAARGGTSPVKVQIVDASGDVVAEQSGP